MKNLSRLTALLLALVMLLGITASATELSDFTKADYDNLVAEQLTPVELPALTATDSGFNFAVAGEVPENAELYVAYMGADATANIRTSILGLPELEEGMSEYAFDISIYENNAEWQPGTPVEVTITGIDTTEDSLVQVYHIPDAAQPAVATYSLRSTPAETAPVEFEEVEVIPGEGTVTFMADGFSIYYVIEGDRQEGEVNSERIGLAVGETIVLDFTNNGSWDISGDTNKFTTVRNGNRITVTANGEGSITIFKGTDYALFRIGDEITISSQTFSVNFNSNYPSGSANVTKTMTTGIGGAVSLPDPADIDMTTPVGMMFAGWATSKSGQGAVYSVGLERYVTNNNTTYYAIWFNPNSTNGTNATFHILNQAVVPYEPTTVQPSNIEYTQNHGLTGTIRNPVAICNNETAVAANILQAPSNAEITQKLADVGTTVSLDEYDENGNLTKAGTHEIVWYVIKWNGCVTLLGNCNRWHVDGYVKEKEKKMVFYNPNDGQGDVPFGRSYKPNVDTVDVEFDPLPYRTGYVFLGWDENKDATSPKYPLDGANNSFLMPDHDVTLYAIWKPYDATEYKVEHYLCDVNGENPQLKETETKYGTTEAEVTADYKTYAGYEAYNHEDTVKTGVIAPDGTLVLKLYYKLSVADLTIKKSGMTNDSTTWENAIFTVVVDGKTSYTVAIPTDESVTIADLPIGSFYTITEDSGWSWRYDQKKFNGTIDSDASKNIVEIENGDPDPRWLSDEGSKTNTYGEEVSDNDH